MFIFFLGTAALFCADASVCKLWFIWAVMSTQAQNLQSCASLGWGKEIASKTSLDLQWWSASIRSIWIFLLTLGNFKLCSGSCSAWCSCRPDGARSLLLSSGSGDAELWFKMPSDVEMLYEFSYLSLDIYGAYLWLGLGYSDILCCISVSSSCYEWEQLVDCQSVCNESNFQTG